MARMSRVAAFVGVSGSGKTTLMTAVIRLLVERGEGVAAIKHTHHPLSERDEGDTARFRAAGAEPVLFAGDSEAVLFRRGGTERIVYQHPSELLECCGDRTVLVEGFTRHQGWPRIEVRPEERQTAEEALAILDRIWRK
ncbi:MAG: mobB [Acidobacteria bacterium]|nr:mobB [Acidobacteriota bacterium]